MSCKVPVLFCETGMEKQENKMRVTNKCVVWL